MAKISVDIDELIAIDLRRRRRADDESCAHGVPFGNVNVGIETALCSVGLSYYHPPVKSTSNGKGGANGDGEQLRKADVYVLQRAYDVSKRDGVVLARNGVAFVGLRATTAHQLAMALLDLSRHKLTLESYLAHVNSLMETEKAWQQQRYEEARNGGEDESSK